jgi:hypothetical protein
MRTDPPKAGMRAGDAGVGCGGGGKDIGRRSPVGEEEICGNEL